ncbi:MAG: hypothetical protein R2874_10995 [Desulfobacterales bacterium]
MAKLRRQLEKIGLPTRSKQCGKKGGDLSKSGADFAFRDMPAARLIPFPAFLSIDISTRDSSKGTNMPSGFTLRSVVPIGDALRRHPYQYPVDQPGTGRCQGTISDAGNIAVRIKVRQYFKILRQALSAIDAPVQIVQAYGTDDSPFKVTVFQGPLVFPLIKILVSRSCIPTMLRFMIVPTIQLKIAFERKNFNV